MRLRSRQRALRRDTKSTFIKGLIDKPDLIKIKTVTLQKTVKKMKRQDTHWKKIFTNHIFNKELVFRMYTENS